MNYTLGKIEVTFGKKPEPERATPEREPFAPWDGFHEVSREEFRTYLAAYGKTLDHNCVTICEPAYHEYFDHDKAGAGTSDERRNRATQAYCVYDEGGGEGPPHFYVRLSENPT